MKVSLPNGLLPLGYNKNDRKKGIILILTSIGIMMGVLSLAIFNINQGHAVWVSGYGLAGLTTPILFYGLKKFGILGGSDYAEYVESNLEEYVDEEGSMPFYNKYPILKSIEKTCTKCTNGIIYLTKEQTLLKSKPCDFCHGVGRTTINLSINNGVEG